ncbi:hypothetical protein BOTNAR_0020g00340 [Botryotinia narcissicola]|uniref:Uncharacterized protein n=1 Tax=Botryotinia narcissicola TaxID=278944 RepID=A0A4Z1JBE0_9HELO|nr:hypothetical protein BOTNAR_0020g00340 [Botryotinia narcissicola]
MFSSSVKTSFSNIGMESNRKAWAVTTPVITAVASSSMGAQAYEKVANMGMTNQEWVFEDVGSVGTSPRMPLYSVDVHSP